MKRETELFNLSFLDLLSAALGAVIFLFIIVPKGNQNSTGHKVLPLTIDTMNQVVFYKFNPEDYRILENGDTMVSFVIKHGNLNLPKNEDVALSANHKSWVDEYKEYNDKNTTRLEPVKAKKDSVFNVGKNENPGNPGESAPEIEAPKTPREVASEYKGDLPSVPCKFSVEIKWENKEDNVDLFLCKNGSCVYGGKRNRKHIGTWDSGKSKNKLFADDLTTNQEAIRQFDEIIPGNYEVFAQFKESKESKQKLKIDGLVYSRNPKTGEQGETFVLDLPLDTKNRQKIGEIKLDENGKFYFKKSKNN